MAKRNTVVRVRMSEFSVTQCPSIFCVTQSPGIKRTKTLAFSLGRFKTHKVEVPLDDPRNDGPVDEIQDDGYGD